MRRDIAQEKQTQLPFDLGLDTSNGVVSATEDGLRGGRGLFHLSVLGILFLLDVGYLALLGRSWSVGGVLLLALGDTLCTLWGLWSGGLLCRWGWTGVSILLRQLLVFFIFLRLLDDTLVALSPAEKSVWCSVLRISSHGSDGSGERNLRRCLGDVALGGDFVETDLSSVS
jgi:hypothetical protein